MSTNKEIPVLLLTGYLGSGKTTLLNNILNNRRGIKFAVIVNDIGEVNIDAKLIQKGGIVGGADNPNDLVALQNGCICCTLRTDLIKQLLELANTDLFDYIVIEASGICEPAPIAQTICSIPQIAGDSYTGPMPVLDCITTVVDALRMQTEFGDGEKLQSEDIDEEDIENLIIQQIEFCNVILLNKISEVTKYDAAKIKAIIRAIQPKAKIIECDYANVDFDELVGTGMFDFEDVATSATWVQEIEGHHDHDNHEGEHEHHHHDEECHDEHCHHHHHHHDEGEAEEYGIQTFVYYRRRPFDLNKFDFFASRWPANIIRSKGVVYFSNNRDMSYLFEQAGVQKNLKEAGYWFATAPADEFEIIKKQNPDMMLDWDEEYGDRMIKIVIIGQNLNREKISADLDACLA